jgi:hypothetical protein
MIHGVHPLVPTWQHSQFHTSAPGIQFDVIDDFNDIDPRIFNGGLWRNMGRAESQILSAILTAAIE